MDRRQYIRRGPDRQIWGRLLGQVILGCLALTLSVVPSLADQPTLARLSFWVPPERMAEFEAVYEREIAPVLGLHDLVRSAMESRATADSVSSPYTSAIL